MADISIIIPILNREETLPRLFDSLDELWCEGLEVLLVDNGSTDRSPSLCAQYAEKSRHDVRCLTEPRRGAGAARNKGLAGATAPWVYFFDSDDELSPTFLHELMPMAEDCDVLTFPIMMERDGKTWPRDFLSDVDVVRQILSGTLCTQTMLINREFLVAAGGWNEDLAVWQDWELGVRLVLRGARVKSVDDNAYHKVHISPRSITFTTDAADRCEALACVAPQLRTDRQRNALILRAAILAGKSGVAVPIPLKIDLKTRMKAGFLWLYSKAGLRGAWRLALWMA